MSHSIGLATEERNNRVIHKLEIVDKIRDYLERTSITPEAAETMLQANNTSRLSQKVKLASLLTRPQLKIASIKEHIAGFSDFVDELQTNNIEECLEEVEIRIKYGGYIDKEVELATKLDKLEDLRLHDDFDYFKLPALSYEAREKLSKIKPSTIGQASRISGVSPADISVLTVYLGR